jgi:mRNA interferase RelE/StbE
MYKIEYDDRINKMFKGIPKDYRESIEEKILSLAENPIPTGSKRLINIDAYRIRVGIYRVIYKIKDDILVILIVKIGHRSKIYDNLE